MGFGKKDKAHSKKISNQHHLGSKREGREEEKAKKTHGSCAPVTPSWNRLLPISPKKSVTSSKENTKKIQGGGREGLPAEQASHQQNV